ncbi:MAG TPA: fumarylacetoacetate hydrolase family protein, partial [Anaerolineales bacterium]|nr:fumarylacetoacetate hydrolase family protein [Anaerolineales bacterium]
MEQASFDEEIASLAMTESKINMKFATVSTLRASSQPALVIEDRVHTLPYPDMNAVIAAGADKAASRASKEALTFDEVNFHSPIHPVTLRDAYAFETHVKTANRNRGQEVPENWYKFPVFYFSNPNNNYGHEDVIPYPAYTQALDYELEI